MKYCLEPEGQRYVRFFLCNVVQGDTYSRDNITQAQIKTLFSVVRKAPSNIAQEEMLCNVVLEACLNLMLLGQHCTGQNPMQCSLGGSRQHCTGKKYSAQCYLNLIGTTLHRMRLQTTVHKKNTGNVV